MHYYTVWADMNGVTVGLPLVAHGPIPVEQLTRIGTAIAEGAGLRYLYCAVVGG